MFEQIAGKFGYDSYVIPNPEQFADDLLRETGREDSIAFLKGMINSETLLIDQAMRQAAYETPEPHALPYCSLAEVRWRKRLIATYLLALEILSDAA